jgi:hypothetical protein
MKITCWDCILGVMLIIASLVGVSASLSKYDQSQILEMAGAVPSSCVVLWLAIMLCYSTHQLESESMPPAQKELRCSLRVSSGRASCSLPTIVEA